MMRSLPKPTKNILFTFDYELYLGVNSGDVSKCMIRPTEKILGMLNSNGFQGIFFVDSIYLSRLMDIAEKFPAANQDLQLITDQLNKIAAGGHEIFVHLHPHWLDAVYRPESNTWDLTDHSKYLFSSVDEATQGELFK